MIVITAVPSPLQPRDCIALLSVLADIYSRRLKVEPLPPLYETSIRYDHEPNAGSGFEQWDDPWTVAKRGWGDCDDLVLFRLSQLRANGERAGVSLLQKGPKMHVQIRRASGKIEDPSLILIDKAKKAS